MRLQACRNEARVSLEDANRVKRKTRPFRGVFTQITHLAGDLPSLPWTTTVPPLCNDLKLPKEVIPIVSAPAPVTCPLSPTPPESPVPVEKRQCQDFTQSADLSEMVEEMKEERELTATMLLTALGY